MLCIIVYNPLAVPLVYFLYSRGCGRYEFGRHSPPCGRHGLILGPLSFVAVIVVPPLSNVMCSAKGTPYRAATYPLPSHLHNKI